MRRLATPGLGGSTRAHRFDPKTTVVELTPDQLRRDVVEGSEDAARRARILVLEASEIDYLVDLFAYQGRITDVERGHEVVLAKDGCANTLYNGQMSSGVGIPLAREQGIRVFGRAFCFEAISIRFDGLSADSRLAARAKRKNVSTSSTKAAYGA